MIGGHFTGSLVRHALESIALPCRYLLCICALSVAILTMLQKLSSKLLRALRAAVGIDPRVDGIPSTKGELSK